MTHIKLQSEIDKDKKDANGCMAIGAGVGVLGAASAALLGAVCPICIVATPGLLGIGAYKRWKIRKVEKQQEGR